MDSSCVAVLGGGPAGMSAALWLKHYGLVPLLLEAAAREGGLQEVSPFANVTLLGHPGATARAIAERFRDHLAFEGIARLRARVTGLQADGRAITVSLEGRDPFRCEAAVLAFGTRFRSLEVPGAREAEEAGRLLSIACEPGLPALVGKQVVVVGGGDNACFLALQAAGVARRTTILCRSGLRAQRRLREAALAHRGISVEVGCTVTALEPDAVVVRTSAGTSLRVPADACIAAIGYVPNTAEAARWLPELQLDEQGYVLVDGDGRTSVPRLWAAGDVCNPRHPCTATAIAQGTKAARNIEWTLDRGAALPWTGGRAAERSTPANSSVALSHSAG